jgi:hypothetical protein
MTVTAAGGTNKIRWWVGGLQLLSLLPELAFVCQPLCAEFLACPDASSNSLTPSTAVARKLFPVLRINVCGFEVALADVLVSQCWSTCWAVSCGKLSIQHVLWNATVLHAMQMAEPPKTTLAEEEMHAQRVGLL